MQVNGINNFHFTLADKSATDVKLFKIFSLLINIHLKKTKRWTKIKACCELVLGSSQKVTCHRWAPIIFKPLCDYGRHTETEEF